MKKIVLLGIYSLNAIFCLLHPAHAATNREPDTLAPVTGPCASYVYLNDEKSFPPDPVYTDEEQKIFWVSPSVAPGENALVKGAFSSKPKTIRLTGIPGGNSATIAATIIGSTGMTFKIPAGFPKGVYTFEVANLPSLSGRINLPQIYWTDGYGSQISPDKVIPGDTLVVVGSDFPSTGNLLLSSGHQTLSIPYRASSQDEIRAKIPLNTDKGNCTVVVTAGRDADAASSAPFPVNILPPAENGRLPVQIIACPDLKGDGQTDNSDALANCLDKSLPKQNIVYIKIPSGVFRFSRQITLHPYQYLTGNGPEATVLKGIPVGNSVPDIWVKGSHHFGLKNIGLAAVVKSVLLGNFSDQGKFKPDEDTTGHICIDNCVLQCIPPNSVSKTSVVLQLGGPDIQVIHSTIDNTAQKTRQNIGMYMVPSNGAYFSDLNIRLGDWGWGVVLGSYHNILFENNRISGETSSPGASAGMTLASNKYQGSSGGILIKGNSFKNIISNNKEAITTDGTNGAYLGYIQSSTPGQVTLRDNPNWTHVGAFEDKKFIITVTAGRGTGQFRYVTAIDGKNLRIDQPWSIIPDQSSVASVSLRHQYIDIDQNQFDNTGAVQFYGGVFDGSIDNNVMTHSRGISLYSPLYSCGCLPLQNIVVQSNSISGNNGSDTTETNGFFIRSNYNGSIGGVVFRDNIMGDSRRLRITPKGVPRMQSFLFENNSGGDFKRLNALPGQGMKILSQ